MRLPPAPSPLDPKKQKSSLSLSEAPPRGLPMRRGRQPSPELRHATSDDNLSSSTGEGPGLHVTWTRPRNRQAAAKNQTPREVDFEARRKKRRSRSFEVTGQAVSDIFLIVSLDQDMSEVCLFIISNFRCPLTCSCLKQRQPRLRGFGLWTAHQTLISTLTVSPRPPCCVPSTEGSLSSPKLGPHTTASKQVTHCPSTFLFTLLLLHLMLFLIIIIKTQSPLRPT